MEEERYKLTMSPLQKYLKRDLFPWKAMVHFLLLVLTGIEVYFMV
jgi:hypothetical protein